MTKNQKILVECELCEHIKIFNELSPAKMRKEVFKYFFDFCEKNEINTKETFKIVRKYLRSCNENGISNYDDCISFLESVIC